MKDDHGSIHPAVPLCYKLTCAAAISLCSRKVLVPTCCAECQAPSALHQETDQSRFNHCSQHNPALSLCCTCSLCFRHSHCHHWHTRSSETWAKFSSVFLASLPKAETVRDGVALSLPADAGMEGGRLGVEPLREDCGLLNKDGYTLIAAFHLKKKKSMWDPGLCLRSCFCQTGSFGSKAWNSWHSSGKFCTCYPSIVAGFASNWSEKRSQQHITLTPHPPADLCHCETEMDGSVPEQKKEKSDLIRTSLGILRNVLFFPKENEGFVFLCVKPWYSKCAFGIFT